MAIFTTNNKIIFTFQNTDPVTGQTITLGVYPNFPDTGVTYTETFTLKNTPVNPNDVQISNNPSIMASNFNAKVQDTGLMNYIGPITPFGTGVEYTTLYGLPFLTSVVTPNNGTVIITYATVLDWPFLRELPVRSSYIYTMYEGTFTDTTTYIREWEGFAMDWQDKPISHIINKTKITPTQFNQWFDLTSLLRENFESGLQYPLYANYTAALDLEPFESKWVHVTTDFYNLGVYQSSATTQYFCMDGFLHPMDDQSLPRVLMTGNERSYERNSLARFYFKPTNLVTSGLYYQTSVNSTPIPVDVNTTEQKNEGYIQSVSIDTSSPTAKWVKYTFLYNDETLTRTFYLTDDCKYEGVDVYFKNKYGVMETICMSKKFTRSLSTTGSKYLKNIVDTEGSYDVRRHTNKEYNIDGQEEWTLNSDFVSDYMLPAFKEIMLSEEIWVKIPTSVGSYTYTLWPVTRVDQNLDYKTEQNDRLYNYTLKVRLSHSEIKNIK